MKKRKQETNQMANYKLLKTSWKHQARIFFEESTLHGVRYIAEKGRPLIEKLLWFICVAIGAIATMVIIVSLWEKFQTNPTITGLDTDFHTWDVPFPAVTICQSIPSNDSLIEEFLNSKMADADNKEDLKEFLQKLSQLSFLTLQEFKPYMDKGYLADDVNLKNFIFEIMNPCEAIFATCDWKSEVYNCCDGFFPVFTESGFCYTFNSRHYEPTVPWSEEKLPEFELRYIKETDSKWSLKFFFGAVNTDCKVAIYIHNSDEVPGIDVKPQHVWDYRVDKMLFSVKQTYTTEDAKQLSIKQRHCIFEHEVKLKIHNIYTYTACTQQCRMDTSVRLCGCVPHFYPEILKYNYRHCRLRELHCVAEKIDEIDSIDRCNCHLGCSNTIYEVEKLNEKADEAAPAAMEAEFVSWPMVRYKREVLFGWVDLLVSFGGIAGLFLGFSLLSGVEVIYYFTIRACCMVNKEKDELIRIQKEEQQEKKPEYDLSLAPYFIKKPKPGQGRQQIVGKYKKNILINFPSKLDMVKKKPIIVRPAPPFGIEFIN